MGARAHVRPAGSQGAMAAHTQEAGVIPCGSLLPAGGWGEASAPALEWRCAAALGLATQPQQLMALGWAPAGGPGMAVGWSPGVGQLLLGQYPVAVGWAGAVAPALPTQYAEAPKVGQAPGSGRSPSREDEAADLLAEMGIQPSEEERFAWIAEYGLRGDVLPPRWTSHTEPTSGRTYYVDSVSEETTWKNPLLPSLLRVLEAGRLYLQQPTDNFFEEQKVLLWHEHKEDLESWHGPLGDGDGQAYFVNSGSGESSRLDPRAETQHVYELEVSLLEGLESVLRQPGEAARTAAGAGDPPLADSLCRGALRDRARHSADLDREGALRRMGSAAGWLRAAREEEAEAQRLQLSRKLRERRSGRAGCPLEGGGSAGGSGRGPPEWAGADFELLPLEGGAHLGVARARGRDGRA
uniref:WW domain-containing protein n=1 Tax=Alexandrium monilatum TaxID=311494 RepID=A0A7S4S6R2_9DINO|mmetsp:Transcript_50355/g.156072  ORF Transcript_50355/g.156072 Transcript_50355/m.156072 type:complete len:410 (+) Transcript_50355:40-1269(+)